MMISFILYKQNIRASWPIKQFCSSCVWTFSKIESGRQITLLILDSLECKTALLLYICVVNCSVCCSSFSSNKLFCSFSFWTDSSSESSSIFKVNFSLKLSFLISCFMMGLQGYQNLGLPPLTTVKLVFRHMETVNYQLKVNV